MGVDVRAVTRRSQVVRVGAYPAAQCYSQVEVQIYHPPQSHVRAPLAVVVAWFERSAVLAERLHAEVGAQGVQELARIASKLRVVVAGHGRSVTTPPWHARTAGQRAVGFALARVAQWSLSPSWWLTAPRTW